MAQEKHWDLIHLDEALDQIDDLIGSVSSASEEFG
jgi:hypothetical protein